MKKIKLYVATSIDGYIADKTGGLDWLSGFPITTEFNYGYGEFFDSVDTVIMGGKTYRDILNMDIIYPYKNKATYVITRNNTALSAKQVYFISENIIGNISKLQTSKGKDIWLVGGGEIVSLFLDYELIDELILTLIPITLGTGIPLFPKHSKESKWIAIKTQKFENGVVQIKYEREKR